MIKQIQMRYIESATLPQYTVSVKVPEHCKADTVITLDSGPKGNEGNGFVTSIAEEFIFGLDLLKAAHKFITDIRGT